MTTDTDVDDALAAYARTVDRDLDPDAASRLLATLLARPAAAAPADAVRPLTLVPGGPVPRTSRRRSVVLGAAVAAVVAALVVGAVSVAREVDGRGDHATGPAARSTAATPFSDDATSTNPSGSPVLPANAGRVLEIRDDDIYTRRDALNAELAAQGYRVGIRETPSISSTSGPTWTCDAAVTRAPDQHQVLFDTRQDASGEIIHVLLPDLLPPDVYLVLGVPRGAGNVGMMTLDFVTGGLPTCMP